MNFADMTGEGSVDIQQTLQAMPKGPCIFQRFGWHICNAYTAAIAHMPFSVIYPHIHPSSDGH